MATEAIELVKVKKEIPAVTQNNNSHLEFIRNIYGPEPSFADIICGEEFMVCHGKGEYLKSVNETVGGCLHQETCPFCSDQVELDPPKGAPCPLEINRFVYMFNGYSMNACPDGKDFSKMSMLKDLCSIEIKLMRAERQLSETGRVTEMSAVSVDSKTGIIIYKKVTTPTLDEYYRAISRKTNLMDQLGLTPKSRAVIGSTITKDPSTFVAEIMTRFRIAQEKEALRDAEQNNKRLIDGRVRVGSAKSSGNEYEGAVIDISSGDES